MHVARRGALLHVKGPTPMLRRELEQTLTLRNPAYDGAVKGGYDAKGIDPVLRFYGEGPDELELPAACEQLVYQAALRTGDPMSYDEQFVELDELELELLVDLRLYQLAAVAEVTRTDLGVLDAPTGAGKTIMGCAAIAWRKQPALVLVHTGILQRQWARAVEQCLGLEPLLIGGGNPTPSLDAIAEAGVIVGMIQSVAKVAGALAPWIGHLVVDECHRVAAKQYWVTLQQFGARYRLGLSATPYRRDGLDPAIVWALGPITEVDRAPLVSSGHLMPLELEQQATAFETSVDASEHYQAAIAELVEDVDRNGQIVVAAKQAQLAGGIVLVLSDRREHCELLGELLAPMAVVLHGQLKAKPRREAEAILAEGGPMIICATVQLVGEGFDLPAAETLLLATPIKFSGRLIQAIGRVLRPAPGKSAGKVVDFADWQVPVLAAGARARARTYSKLLKDQNTTKETPHAESHR